MHLVTFRAKDGEDVGVLDAGNVVSLRALVPDAPRTMIGVIEGGETLKAA